MSEELAVKDDGSSTIKPCPKCGRQPRKRNFTTIDKFTGVRTSRFSFVCDHGGELFGGFADTQEKAESAWDVVAE